MTFMKNGVSKIVLYSVIPAALVRLVQNESMSKLLKSEAEMGQASRRLESD